MKLAKPALILIGLAAWSGLATAQMIGNPVPTIDEDQWEFGLSIDQFIRDLDVESEGHDLVGVNRYGLQAGYGWTKERLVQVFASDTSFNDSESWRGWEVGLGYRQIVDITIPMGNKEAHTAAFGQLRYGSLSDGKTLTYLQFDGGYGASYPILEALNVYAAAVLSNIRGQAGSSDVDAVNHVGLMAGAEYTLNEKIRFTGEVHVVHEYGVALMVQYFL